MFSSSCLVIVAVVGTLGLACNRSPPINDADFVAKVQALVPGGLDHIVEVAFAANIDRDVELLKLGGTLSTYATNDPKSGIPFWPMVFKNIQLNFLGSDDFPIAAKLAAANDLNSALAAGWSALRSANDFR
jgi:NADPH:quinone reductase